MAAFTLDYWIEDGWYVGRLREVPGIFSQGETLDDLKLNIKHALELMLPENKQTPGPDYESESLPGAGQPREPGESLTLVAGIQPEAARARLDAVRSALVTHEDEGAEQLVRKMRDQRTLSLDVSQRTSRPEQ